MTDLERLLAIEAIKVLKARALRAMDGKDWPVYETLHAPDHVSDTYGGEPAVGAKANTARLAQVLEGITTVHHAHMPEITLTSADTAEGIWSMEDMLFWKQGAEEHWLHGYGHYHERYRRGPEGWQFVHRRLTRIRVDLSDGADFGNLNVRTREA